MTEIEFWNLLVGSLSTLLAAIALLTYVIFWQREKYRASYATFDAFYLEILKLGIEYPYLRSAAFTSCYDTAVDPEMRARYEAYAFICWNFCETIFDKGDYKLLATWESAIVAEAALHRAWFLAKENEGRYRREFREFICTRYLAVPGR